MLGVSFSLYEGFQILSKLKNMQVGGSKASQHPLYTRFELQEHKKKGASKEILKVDVVNVLQFLLCIFNISLILYSPCTWPTQRDTAKAGNGGAESGHYSSFSREFYKYFW